MVKLSELRTSFVYHGQRAEPGEPPWTGDGSEPCFKKEASYRWCSGDSWQLRIVVV
jgi:hypothetical protein